MFSDNRSSLCSGTRATLLHLSLRSRTSIRHQVFQGYPISSWQKSIPGPWDRPSINSGGRNMGQPPELNTPHHYHHYLALCTTQSKWTRDFSSNFIQPATNASALKVAAMFQSQPWFTQTHPITNTGVCAGMASVGLMHEQQHTQQHLLLLQRFSSSTSSQKN